MIKLNLSRQEITYTAIFGGLWGLLELSLGTSLHLAKIPFRGVVMSLIAAAVLVCAKYFLRYRGSLLFIGAITSTLKAITAGGFIINPMLAIIAESGIAEVIFLILGYGRISAIISGASVLTYTFVHGLIFQGVFFGFGIYKIYYQTLTIFANKIGFGSAGVYIIFAILLLFHIVSGAAAGIFGFLTAKRTAEKLKIKNE